MSAIAASVSVLTAPRPAERQTSPTFRPDVEGLRAIAVALVVLFHAGIPHLAGGYVGVDVFFVLSGFLITELLLRERESTGGTSLLHFYARRVRRILPAATLVLVLTVLASYWLLGFIRADVIAADGQWVALFTGNIHFALQGTQYFNALEPPSPLQHYWSLAVEEQFYLVYPTLILFLGVILPSLSMRQKLAPTLVLIILASFLWSIAQTSRDPTWAFFSPLTRAWELAIGGLLAALGPALRGLSERLGAVLSWAGVAGIVASAFLFDGATPFPGYVAALPVLGTAAVVLGGTAGARAGAAALLSLPPLQWLGKLSYSLYLWHWPVLLIAAQYAGRTLSLGENLALAALALALSAAMYFGIENRVRYARVLVRRPALSLALGVGLVALAFGLCTTLILTH